MTNGRVRLHDRHVDSPRGQALALLAAAWALAVVPAPSAQEEALEVTLQVLDDLSDIEGVLMPLEEEPTHATDTDSAPAPESSPPAKPAGDVVR